MTEIPLTQGKVALVDDDDVERIIQYLWRAEPKGDAWYASSIHPRTGQKMYLHRFILNLESGDSDMDHINGNGLDCRKSNLRLATRSQNGANRPKFSGRYSSKYKGVGWKKQNQRWAASIRVNTKLIHLGYFLVEEDAARAYDRAAIKYFGEFAKTNFPREDYEFIS